MKTSCICDSHTHTCHSPDGDEPIAAMCQAAEDAGLYAVTITDHCECNDYFKDGYYESVGQSYLETRRIASSWKGALRIYAGIELGQPMQDRAVAEQILRGAAYDFVLGSVHNIRGKEDFFFLDYQKENVESLMETYLEEVLEMVEWGEFDSLAHLTYPLRYIVWEAGIPFDFSKIDGKVDKILHRLAEKKMALEINTSGLRQKIGTTLPPLSIVRRFRELGGEYVTLGSDAHSRKDVGAGIREGMKIAAEAGFTHYTVFENRIPKQIPLL